MRSKGPASVKCNGKPIVYNGVEHEGDLPAGEPGVFAALQSNIQESFDEIEILRGTLQYWEKPAPRHWSRGARHADRGFPCHAWRVAGLDREGQRADRPGEEKGERLSRHNAATVIAWGRAEKSSGIV